MSAPIDMNILKWQAVIFGPEETPWSGGTFKLLIEFSEEYPNKPQMLNLKQKCFIQMYMLMEEYVLIF